ncbi:MAG: ABC transporter ATP-binding protein [Lachnospiraceae bacterium]|nr:ABC transporter ATP-binding protein [Lachnospiraceae bacterium]
MSDLKKLVQYTWRYLSPHKGIILLFLIVYFINQMIDMANTFLIGAAIDSMLLAGTMEAIIRFAVLFLGLNLFSFVSCYIAKVGGQKAAEVARLEAKCQISRHVEKTSLGYCGTAGSMSFMQRLNRDSAMLVFFVINSIGEIPGNFLILLTALTAVFRINAVCGIAALVELPVNIGLYMAFRKRLLERGRECARKCEQENRRLYELLADTAHIKKNEIFPILEERYKEAGEESIDAIVKSTRMEFVYSIINNNMDVFLKVFLFFYGGMSVIRGTMSVGEFTIIYSYFSLVTSSCTYFLNLGKQIQDHKAYYERLKEITDVPEESNGIMQLNHINEITLSNVTFGYNETDTVLQEVSYTFRKGNLYVIGGGNGCGKSTLISLMLGMYMEEYQGNITYNGYSLKDLDMRTLRREKIGVCEQEPYLMEDTVRYNMIYSNDKKEDDKLMTLAYHVSFERFLKTSEQGLDTLAGEGGNALSGGQKQKTALIKAFYKNPDVLVLDEPTSAMDAEGQERLIKYLGEIKKDKIIIVITHDEKMMDAADEVVRMQKVQ